MATELPPPHPPTTTFSLALPVCGSTLDQRSQSAEPVIIEAAEGAEPLPPSPWRSINISQIRLQKNTVFIRFLCKLWRRVSPSILCGEPFFLLSALCVWQKFAYFRLKRVTDLHINRASWWECGALRCETEITQTEQKQSFSFTDFKVLLESCLGRLINHSNTPVWFHSDINLSRKPNTGYSRE